ncbi:fimbrial protein [Chimaeribacter coloradensis]|uniref:Fimbrial protein n=2 Tax=Chimaeribacter coloradensis TaxID=2060068 RepID=A0A2N5EBH1_9GAMM|nr:fimbrial protein [Chimaeribacter coloradensis]
MTKRRMACRAAPLVLLVSGGLAQAQNVDITFKANIVETTCTMKLTGGSGDGLNNTLQIGPGGKVGLDKLLAGDQSATATFSLDVVECPSSLDSLKTTVNGSNSNIVPSAIKNGVAKADGGADYVGVTIARSSDLDNPFKINSLNDNERLVWTASEIQAKKVNLTARLVETDASRVTPGQFRATATFAFTYE